MFSANQHLRVAQERRHRVVVLILATHREQDASLVQFENVLLETAESFTARRRGSDLDTLDPVVAHDASPQGVVEVHHEHLRWCAAE